MKQLAAALCVAMLATTALHARPGRTGGASTRATRSYLGVDVADVTVEQATALKLDKKGGAQITRVDHDGPAGKAGLCVHDVVLRLNGAWIASQDQFRKLLRESPPGKKITLQINRDGQMMDVSTELADRTEVERRAWDDHYVVPPPAPAAPSSSIMSFGFLGSHIPFTGPYTGVTVDTMSEQLAAFFGCARNKGLLIQGVESNSPGANAGLHAGDVILRANNREMTGTGEWNHAIRDARGGRIPVIILRDHHEVSLWLTPGGKKRSALEGVHSPYPHTLRV